MPLSPLHRDRLFFFFSLLFFFLFLLFGTAGTWPQTLAFFRQAARHFLPGVLTWALSPGNCFFLCWAALPLALLCFFSGL